MTEMSQMSEMSTADAGPPGKDASKPSPVKMIVVVVLVLLVVILLMLIMFDEAGTGEAHGGDGSGDGSSGGGESGSGDSSSGGGFGFGKGKSKETTESTTTTTTRTTPVPIKRPVAFLFCTVGAFSESATAVFDSMFCDYFVYTHVLPYRGDILSYESTFSWEEFKKRATAYRDKLSYLGYPNATKWGSVKLQHYGYSFTTEDLGWLKSQLSSVTSKVARLYKDNGLLTAGLGYYDRKDGSKDSEFNNIKSILKNIDDMLVKAQDLNTTVLKTTFLAVKFAGMSASAANDASALQEYKGLDKIDLLILLTHLVNVPSEPNCKILQLSRYSGDALDAREPPSMERLLSSIDKLKGVKFRVAFSLTFTLFLYKPTGGLKDTTKYGDGCQNSFFDDYNAVCGVPDTDITLNADPSKSSATYAKKDSGIFMVFETMNTTKLKASKASEVSRKKGVELTWAAYDVHRDVKSCGVDANVRMERLSALNDTLVADYAVPEEDK